MTIETSDKRPCAVYRFYDAEDRLLYVGIAFDPETRWRSHRKQPWWPLAARHEIVWMDDRDSCERAERKAIKVERPRFNRSHVEIPGFVMASEARSQMADILNRVHYCGEHVGLLARGDTSGVLLPWREYLRLCAAAGEEPRLPNEAAGPGDADA